MTSVRDQSIRDYPKCSVCKFVMPSETSQTKLRCGLSYFNASPLMRKIQRMDNFPVVKSENACESWQSN